MILVAVEADEGMLLPNRRWDTVSTNNDWYQDLSKLYAMGPSSYRLLIACCISFFQNFTR